MTEVRALETGFYDGMRRRAGEVFEVEDGVKAKWFVPVGSEADVKASKAKTKAPAAGPKTLAEAAGTKGKSQTELLKEQGKGSAVAQTGADLA
jgi:hypothetical protein